MKNVQIIDGARNSTYEIYQVPDDLFDLMFPNGTDIAFLDDAEKRFEEMGMDDSVWEAVYRNRVDKRRVVGIHGTLHLPGSVVSKEYFPTLKEAEVIGKKAMPKRRK